MQQITIRKTQKLLDKNFCTKLNQIVHFNKHT